MPPKKPQKARAPAEAPKPDAPKPDISEVERMIEQECAAAVQPRETDDVFAAVPEVKRKDKRKEKKDKKKKILDVEFGERGVTPACLHMIRGGRRIIWQRVAAVTVSAH